MKKKLLSIIAVLFVGMSVSNIYAQSPLKLERIAPRQEAVKATSLTKKMEQQELRLNEKLKGSEVMKGFPTLNQYTQAADGLNAYYHRPAGTLLGGMQADSRGYVPLFAGHATADWTFLNRSTGYSNLRWDTGIDGLDVTTDNAGNGTLTFGIIGNYRIMPTLTAISGANSDSYYYGQDIVESGDAPYSLLVLSNHLYMTSADFNYSPLYTGIGGGLYGFGTGKYGNDIITGVMQHYEKPQAPLFMENVGIFLHSNNNTPLAPGAKLTCTVYITKDGKLSEEVATADIYADELIEGFRFTSGTIGYYARFNFVEYDPVTGLESPIDVVVNDSYAITVTGFNETGVNAGVMFADNEEWMGNGSVLLEGGYYNWYGDYDEDGNFLNGCDLAIMIEGSFTQLEKFADLTVPVTGGTASMNYNGTNYDFLAVETTYDIEYLSYEISDDWLEADWYDNSHYEEDNVIYLSFKGENLPAGMEGRTAQIILTSGSGRTVVSVHQGVTGISSSTAEQTHVTRVAEGYELSYPSSLSNVSLINIAGQTIANYELPNDGKFTLSTTTLADGIYILKFNGEENISIKILK